MTTYPDFIPGTCERHIADNIVFRPVRSWHSLTPAGEGLTSFNDDGSGCVNAQRKCNPPLTVTHRLYWNKTNPTERLSAFLSYPGGMGYWGEGEKGSYFWELYVNDGITRFGTEEELEETILALLRTEPLSP